MTGYGTTGRSRAASSTFRVVRTVARINVTPVKSMALHHPERVVLTERGLADDRRFFLVNDRGELFNGSDAGSLMQITPSFDPATDRLSLRFPGGERVDGDAAATGEAHLVSFYGRAVTAHEVEGPFAGAVGRFIGHSVRLLRCDLPGDGVDDFPLTLVSTASVADLAHRAGYDAELDSRRFRMNLELEGCEPYEEDSWAGHRLQIGEASLRIVSPVPRCVVTQLDPDTGEKDFATLTHIARYRQRIPRDGGLPFGMYAEVLTPGTIAAGDEVVPVTEGGVNDREF
jgi:uncharacterized protein